jgi:hypothetical membrane protein
MTTHRINQRLSLSTLFWVAPLTLLACIIANTIVRSIAVTLVGVSSSFQPLQLPTIIVSTCVYLLLAVGALLLVSRMSERPARTYRILASVCLLLSLLLPLMALTGAMPTPGMSGQIFWSMIAMHLVSAAVVIALLPLAVTRR